MKPEIEYFQTPSAWRAWLKANHCTAKELHVGFFKKHAATPSITWPQSVAEALCFGWIDGVRKRIDDNRYVIRFTPRRRGSIWSAVNMRLMKELESAGKMTDAGRAAFDACTQAKSEVYSYERKNAALDDERLRQFKKNKSAWAYFDAQPPGYKKKIAWWIMSAKTDETRNRRLAQLIEASVAGKRLI